MAGESSSGQAGWLLSGLSAGALVAGYRLEARIGAGGMAVVFRARDEALGRTVALKVLAPGLAGDEEFRERFIRESRAAATVDHPHIIPVYAAGEADGVLYIAMRFVASGDLRSVTYREGPLPADRAAAFISPVASALDAAHEAGLVHRDVKPANILVDTNPGRPDHPYLSDFGLSKGALSSIGLTGAGQFIGTPDYCAPEQISGKPVHLQTDQYALACVAFTLLTTKMPFARDEPMAVLWAHMSEPPPSVTARRPDLKSAVDHVLARALAKAPEDRYDSCGDFADALRGALGLAGYTVRVPARPTPVAPVPPDSHTDGPHTPTAHSPAPAPVVSGIPVDGPATSDLELAVARNGEHPQRVSTRKWLPAMPRPWWRRVIIVIVVGLVFGIVFLSWPLGLTLGILAGTADTVYHRYRAQAPRRRQGRRRWPIVTTLLAVLVLALGGGLYGGWQYIQGQYYVGVQDGNVAIFRGVNQNLLGISLTSLVQRTKYPISQVGGAAYQDQVRQTISASSLAGAQSVVGRIESGVASCHQQWLALAAWQSKDLTYRQELAFAAKDKKFKVPAQDNPGPQPPMPEAAECAPASAFGIAASSLPGG